MSQALPPRGLHRPYRQAAHRQRAFPQQPLHRVRPGHRALRPCQRRQVLQRVPLRREPWLQEQVL